MLVLHTSILLKVLHLLVEPRGMCPTGGTGMIVTQGFYNCYVILDKGLLVLGVLLLIVGLIFYTFQKART